MGDGMLHIDRLGLLHRTYVHRSVCGKVFGKTQEHVYRVLLKGEECFTCSWTCHRVMSARAEEEKAKERAAKNKKAPMREQAWNEDVMLTKEDRIEAFLKRIKECKKKEAHYNRVAMHEAPNTPGRKNARNNAREWRKRMSEAQKALEELQNQDS